MNDKHLNNILEQYKQQDDTWLMNVMQLNMDCIEKIQLQKAKTRLQKASLLKKWMIVAGIVWEVFLLAVVFAAFDHKAYALLISAFMIAALNGAAVLVYMQHVSWISRINRAGDVITVQQQLARLQSSTINITRILFLQMPFYTTWFFNARFMQQDPVGFWAISVPIAVLFTAAALWLYKNIDYKNKDKKWFRFLFSSIEWTALVQAREFLKDIEEFKTST